METARILAIDDDPLIGLAVKAALDPMEVTPALSGEGGLEQFAAQSFDLVICDLGLPGIDGLEVIQRIRAMRPETPVMVLSADGRPERLIGSLRQRVVDFVVKPVTPNDLRTAVSNVLGGAASIEVISSVPHWIELQIPASFQVAASLTHFFSTLQADLDEATRSNVSTAFRELVNNAIEHGAKGDSRQRIRVSCVRTPRSMIYRIDDPGPGFDLKSLPHAAISYPEDPVAHIQVRQVQGLRAGGYGMLWTQSLADEVVYDEKRNKVMFIKYFSSPTTQ